MLQNRGRIHEHRPYILTYGTKILTSRTGITYAVREFRLPPSRMNLHPST